MKKYFDLSKVELGADGKVEFNDPSLEELNQEQMKFVGGGDVTYTVVVPTPQNNWTWFCDGGSPANVDCTNYTGCSEEQNAGDCRNYLICSDGSNYGSSCTNTNFCSETSNANC